MVMQRRRRNAGVARRFDGGAGVHQRRRLTHRVATGIQRPADGEVCPGIDQRMRAIHQRCDAQVHGAPGCDDGAAARAGAVHQRIGLNRDLVPVDAGQVIHTARVDARDRAIDQAGIGQALCDGDGVGITRQKLTGGVVVKRICLDVQVAPGADGRAVVQRATHRQVHVAATGQVARLVQGACILEGQVTRGLQRAQAMQHLRDDRQAVAPQQLALAVFQRIRHDVGVALGGHLAALVVEFAGGQGQVVTCLDGAALVVDAVRHNGDDLAQHALGRRLCSPQRGAVVQRGRCQRQGVVGLDQATVVVERAAGVDDEIAARHRARAVDDRCGIDLHVARRGDQPFGVVELTA
ncbi:hypothetical protein D3C86_622680 [compost metagenome]